MPRSIWFGMWFCAFIMVASCTYRTVKVDLAEVAKVQGKK